MMNNLAVDICCFSRCRTVFLVFAACIASPLLAQPSWRVVDAEMHAKGESAAVYDQARGHIFMFGGNDGSSVTSSSWALEGSEWEFLTADGPPARAAHAMAYDAGRGHTLLFGGKDLARREFGDTWLWDGTTWAEVLSPGPLARSDHAMVFDPISQTVILFGGIDTSNNYLADTWAWDGAAWTLLEVPGPSARSEHAMAYDAARQQIVLFGGIDGVTPNDPRLSDTWTWNGSAWTEHEAVAPDGRSGHAMSYDESTQVVYLHGGLQANSSAEHSDDMWSWNGSEWTVIAQSGPRNRAGHVLVYNPQTQHTVMHGYRRNTYSVDTGETPTWAWDGQRWAVISDSGPARRYFAAAGFDQARNELIFLGGIALDFSSTGDLWRMSNGSWTEGRSVGAIGARDQITLVFDELRQQLMTFGGRSSDIGPSQTLGDTLAWDGDDWVTLAQTGPDPRSTYAMAYDPIRGETVLFGGFSAIDGTTTLGDAWAWNGTEWRSLPGGPPSRAQSAMAFDPVSQRLIMYGGIQYIPRDTGGYEINNLDDTWAFDGSQWELLLTNTAPPPRQGHAIALDPVTGQLLMAGGSIRHTIDPSRNRNSTLTWTGSDWTKLEEGGFREMIGVSMVTDPSQNRIVFFPEFDLGYYLWEGSRWEFVAPPSAPSFQLTGAAYEPTLGGVLAFGGYINELRPGNQTWHFNGARWRCLGTNGPSARGIPLMATDPVNNNVILYGGFERVGSFTITDVPLTDTWIWNGASWSQASSTGPDDTSGGAMAFDVANSNLVFFGNFVAPQFAGGRTYFGETWIWNGTFWNKRLSSYNGNQGPIPRLGHAMAYDKARSRVILFGGRDIDGNTLNDTWAWDGLAWTQLSAQGPAELRNLQMTWDDARQQILMVSRATYSSVGSTWAFDGFDWTQLSDTGPGLSGSTIVGDDLRGEVVMVGEFQEHGFGGVTAVFTQRCSHADINADGFIDIADIIAFVNLFLAGEPQADLNGDGILDIGDISQFVELFLAGC